MIATIGDSALSITADGRLQIPNEAGFLDGSDCVVTARICRQLGEEVGGRRLVGNGHELREHLARPLDALGELLVLGVQCTGRKELGESEELRDEYECEQRMRGSSKRSVQQRHVITSVRLP